MRLSAQRLWERAHEDGERMVHDGLFEDAGARFRAALGYARAAGIDDARLASTLNQLALLNERCGRLAEALTLYRRALATEEHALGPDHPYVAMVLRGYAHALRRTHHIEQAAALEARADAIWSGATRPRKSGESTEAAVA